MIKNTEKILTVREMQMIHEGIAIDHCAAKNNLLRAFDTSDNSVASLAFSIYAWSLVQSHENAIRIHNNLANNLLFLN